MGSLSLNDALFHIPLYFVVWNLFSIATSAIVYEEFAEFGARSFILFPSGVTLLFAGVIMAAKRESFALSIGPTPDTRNATECSSPSMRCPTNEDVDAIIVGKASMPEDVSTQVA